MAQDRERPAAKGLFRQQFGHHAGAYATSSVHAKGQSLERLIALMHPQPAWRVLDVATGAGHTALAIAPHVACVVASDMTAEMLAETAKLAAARGIGNVETAEADAERLPFADQSFDAVTCRLAAHHFAEPARFVAEAWRVLEPSGLLGVVDNTAPDASTMPGLAPAEIAEAAAAYNRFEALSDPSHGRALSVEEWRGLITGAGFAIEATERAKKDIDFSDWVRRMGCDGETIARLEALLLGTAPLSRFLAPRREADRLTFDLEETIFVARRRG
jgi:ubiquinone/menaquinone biosynthesis C-methylase UbiE